MVEDGGSVLASGDPVRMLRNGRARTPITASAATAGISGLRPSASAQRSQKAPACSTWRPSLGEPCAFGSPQHLRAEEAQHGRQQGQRRQHGQADHERDCHGHAGQGGVRQGEQPQQRGAYGQPGQQHSAAGGVERGDGGVLGCLPGEQLVAVPADDEQRVVHAHAERHEEGDLGHPARDRDGVREDVDDVGACCDRHQRRDHRKERTVHRAAEREEQHDQREHDPQQHAGVIRAPRRDVLDRRTAELDVQQRTVGGLGGGYQLVDGRVRDVLSLGVEVHRGEADRAVPADLAARGRRPRSPSARREAGRPGRAWT